MDLYIKKIENGKLYYGKNGDQIKNVSDKVDPRYIREGFADVSEIDGTVTFIKMLKKESPQFNDNSNIKPATFTNNPIYRRPIEIIRQECLCEAVKIISLKNSDNVVDDVIELANKLVHWVSK